MKVASSRHPRARPARSRFIACCRRRCLDPRREHAEGRVVELVAVPWARVVDPVLDQPRVGVLRVLEHQAATVQHAVDHRLGQDARPQRVAEHHLALRRIEVLVHVAGPDDVRCIGRIGEVDRLRVAYDTKSATGAVGVVVATRRRAGVDCGRAVGKLDRQLRQEHREHAALEVGERQPLVAAERGVLYGGGVVQRVAAAASTRGEPQNGDGRCDGAAHRRSGPRGPLRLFRHRLFVLAFAVCALQPAAIQLLIVL